MLPGARSPGCCTRAASSAPPTGLRSERAEIVALRLPTGVVPASQEARVVASPRSILELFVRFLAALVILSGAWWLLGRAGAPPGAWWVVPLLAATAAGWSSSGSGPPRP